MITANSKVVFALLAMNSLPAAMLFVSMARGQELGLPRIELSRPTDVELSASADKTRPGPSVPMEPFMVPLSLTPGDDEDHSIQIELEIELIAERDRGPVVASLSRVRDSIISFLADRTAADVRGGAHMGQLKSALVSRMNETLHAPHVAGVYVKNLLIE